MVQEWFKKWASGSWMIQKCSFFLDIKFTLFKQKVYCHQALIYLNVTGIPVKKPLQNSQIVEKQLAMWILGVICASFLAGRHLLINKKDKNSRYTNIKIMTNWQGKVNAVCLNQ